MNWKQSKDRKVNLTLSSFFGSWSLIRAFVLLRNQWEIFLTRALTVFLPVARARLVTLCLCPCSMGSENLLLKCPKLPRQPGMALYKETKNIFTQMKVNRNLIWFQKLFSQQRKRIHRQCYKQTLRTYQSMTHHSSSRLFCKMVPVRPILI